jgi:hypothetical protein
MLLNFLQLPPADRKVYVDEAASRLGVSAVMLEKDFWVCWLLGVLFESAFSDVLVFKGGTSLSKVFGVIDRFSEDIDLSLAPTFLGLADEDGAVALSKGQASKWMKRAEEACALAVRERLGPEFERTISKALTQQQSRPWLEFSVDAVSHSPMLLFGYPTTQPAGFDYLKRVVKLEFGSLTEQRPTERHAVRPWIADVFPEAFGDWQCRVVALDVQRTFWEKATILHSEFHRPVDKPAPDRFSRHYADTVALARHPVASRAIDQRELRDRVVGWKSRFFGSGWARYDLARPDTFRLLPPDGRQSVLRRDYEAMRDMYLAEPTPFDAILGSLADLEQRINAK